MEKSLFFGLLFLPAVLFAEPVGMVATGIIRAKPALITPALREQMVPVVKSMITGASSMGPCTDADLWPTVLAGEHLLLSFSHTEEVTVAATGQKLAVNEMMIYPPLTPWRILLRTDAGVFEGNADFTRAREARKLLRPINRSATPPGAWKLDAIIKNHPVVCSSKNQSELMELSLSLLESCSVAEKYEGDMLAPAGRSNLHITFPLPRHLTIFGTGKPVEVKELFVSLPLSTGSIYVRTDTGVIRCAMYDPFVAYDLEDVMAAVLSGASEK